MKRGGGKRKGSRYESDICKQLSLWWGKQDDIFYKTQGSGNRATIRQRQNRSTSGQYGDVCSVDGRGRKLTKVCVISIKRGYSKFSVHDLLDSDKETEFHRWIADAVRDQKAAKVLGWMLIHKRDRREPMIFISAKLFWALEEENALFLHPGNTAPYMDLIIKKERIFGIRFNTFLKTCKKIHFKEVFNAIQTGD